jgi:hypothetical protein
MITRLARAQADAEGAGSMTNATSCFVLRGTPRLASVGEDLEGLRGHAPEDFLTAPGCNSAQRLNTLAL